MKTKKLENKGIQIECQSGCFRHVQQQGEVCDWIDFLEEYA